MDDAEFIYYTDKDGCINSGGFCIKSIMLKNKISPIITLNNTYNEQFNEQNINKVSDIFDDLVLPNWAYLQPRAIINNTDYNENLNNENIKYKKDYNNDDDEIIDDYLYNQLLELVKEKEDTIKKEKKNESRKKKKFKTTKLTLKNKK
jgi:hypothetical protein